MFAKIAKNTKDLTVEYATPLQIPYMRKLIYFLELLGAWPYNEIGVKRKIRFYIDNRFFILYYLFAITSSSHYVSEHQKYMSFDKMGQIYITIFMGVFILHRTSMTWQTAYRDVVKRWVQRIHLFYAKHDKSEEVTKIRTEIGLICVFYVKLMRFQAYGAGVLFCFVPIFLNYIYGMYGKNRPKDQPFDNCVFYSLPFDYENDLKGHVAVYLANILAVFHCSLSFAAYDAILLMITFHLWGQLRILKHKLKIFPKPANGNKLSRIPPFYTEEESVNVAKLLKEIIEFHRLLRDFNNDAADAFGMMMLLNCAFQQISLCLLLLKCTNDNLAELLRFGIVTVYVLQQLIIVSVTFELVKSQCETLKDAVYDIPWEAMGTKNRRTVHILLFVSQSYKDVKALGIIPIGFQTMNQILKTTLSYFMLLRTFQN